MTARRDGRFSDPDVVRTNRRHKALFLALWGVLSLLLGVLFLRIAAGYSYGYGRHTFTGSPSVDAIAMAIVLGFTLAGAVFGVVKHLWG